MADPPEPYLTAKELLAKVREHGGRIHRMRENIVFVLTDSESLAKRLLDLGGYGFTPAGDTHVQSKLPGFFQRSPEKHEWDILIHTIPVLGEQTVWEAAEMEDRYDVPPV